MKRKIDNELYQICKDILLENKKLEEWVGIESSDMFQTDNYSGGFDAIENEFCFSYYESDKEYWFQISLKDVEDIVNNKLDTIKIRIAHL